MGHYILKIAFTIALGHGILQSQTPGMATVKGGSFVPLYGVDSLLVTVPSFEMDIHPVTQAQFLDFVKEHPDWRRDRAKKLFVDGNYLRNWESELSLGPKVDPDSPVTNVSWFAAKRYCECQGKTLPSVHQWEFAGMADETS